jgi:NodT family efflux transporter outer membrane factor (OMF) lipoprotein
VRFVSFALAAALALSAACAVGPRYQRPTAPGAPAFKELEGWTLAQPQDGVLRGKWWEIFGDAELNALEDKLDINNQNIAQAFESYMAARALVRTSRAALYPTVTAGASVSRSDTFGSNASASESAATPGTNSVARSGTNFQLPADVSWQPDFFGKVRSQVSQTTAAAQVSAANLENVRLSARASLAQFYFQLRGEDALQRLYAETIDSDRKALDITRTRFETGIASQQDVVQAEVTLHAAEANATAIRITRAQYEHAIAVLVGQAPGGFSLPMKALEAHPPAIPIGLPSQLLERRPDIASAERTAAEANALIGVGKAAYYPSVTLSGSVAAEAATLSQLVTGPVGLWTLGASLAQTLIDHGARKATVQQYEAQYRASVASYRQTVLTAFKEVEDTLVSSRELVTQLAQQQQAAEASARYRDLAQTRYETGVDTYLNVLTAQNALLTNQQSVVTIQTNQMVTSVQLITALGGGWDAAAILKTN